MDKEDKKLTPTEWAQVIFWWLFSIAMITIVCFKVLFLLHKKI